MSNTKVIDEIGQISIYLAKEKLSFETLLDPESDHSRQRNYRVHDFVVEDASCRFIYYETVSNKLNPPWLDFINNQLTDVGPITFESISESPNGILLMAIGERIFAATFGRSASSCLAKKALENDFGIKTAMNMCGNEEIRQTKSQNNTLTITQIDRQVSRPSDAFTFGLGEAEELKYISAHMKGDKNITLQGRDTLTIKIIGEEKISWKKLIDRCRLFLQKYSSRDYVSLFPNYKNFRAASDDEATQLDAALIEALSRKELEKFQLSIPEFLSENEFSFTYTDYASKDNIVYSHLDIGQLENALNFEKLSIDQLHSKRIYAFSLVENKVLSYKKWSIYDCLIFEHELDGKYFLFTDGRWSQVDADFYQSVIDFVRDKLRVEPHEKEHKDICIFDQKTKKNTEAVFNKEFCRKKVSSILFDRAQLRIGGGLRNKEFCDILDTTKEGVVRIVHCKPFKQASSINYLLSQAKFYCEAFLRDEVFLTDIRKHIEKSSSKRKAFYLKYIGPEIEKIRGQDYIVCLWLLYDRRSAVPTKESIPLISKYEFKLMHDHLRRTCKYSDIILRFVPVEMIQFRKAISPKKLVD